MTDLDRPNPTEKELRDLLPSYVLGNLEPDELLTVNDHLDKYPNLLEELRSLEHTAMQLAYNAPAASPPVGSKERIIARARVDREQSPVAATSATPASRSNGLTASAAAAGRTSIVRYAAPSRREVSPPRRSWLSHLGEWWTNALGWKMYAVATTTALALLAIIFNQTQGDLQQALTQLTDLTSQNVQLETARVVFETERSSLESYFGERQEENDALIDNLKSTLQVLDNANTKLRDETAQLTTSNTELTAANSQLETVNTQLRQENTQLVNNAETLEGENAELQQTIETLEGELGAQDRFWAIFPSIRRLVTLEGTTPQSTASGSLWTSDDGPFLLVDGLEPLSDDQTYQLWLITEDEDAIDSGLITLSPDDPSPIAVELPLGIGEFAAVGLSIEPAGGSTAPTDVVLLGLRT